ncbi:AAA family ATPase, partial [Streptococcus dysgalactiae]
MSDILSDTKYRGEFEKKLTNIIKETIEKERILFIDEIHILIQAGGVEGGISASNILKPFLTEEHFQIIGATTKEESKYFSEDRALERRFNFLHLPELPKEVLYKMFCKELSELENNELKNQAQMCEEFERLIKKLDLILPQRNYPDKL